jgi:hypothetical protein
VLLGQRELPVTERELAILARLCEEPGRARSFAELAEPEGRDWLGDTERVHAAIRRLRRKLAEARVQATIESVRGYGFRIVGRSVDPPPVIRGGSGPLPEEVMATNRMSRLKDRLTKMQLSRGCVGSIRSVPPVSLLLRFCTALPIPWRDRHDQSGSEHVAVAATGTHLGG